MLNCSSIAATSRIRHRVAQPSLEMDTCTGKHDFVYRKRTSYTLDVGWWTSAEAWTARWQTSRSILQPLSARASAVSETMASNDAVEDNLASYNRRFKER